MVRANWLVVGSFLALTACSGSGTVTASAGSDQTVSGGQAVTLDASGSKDSGGATLTYAWSQTSGPNVSLSNASSAKATFTAPTVTSSTVLSFTVTVTDGKSSAAASTTVTVQAGNGPIAVINAPSSATSGTLVTLDGSGSHGGTGTLTFSWAQSSGSPTVTLSSDSGAMVTFTAPTVTSQTALTFVLAAIDGSGHVGRTMATVNILPPGSGTPPTAMAGANPTSVVSGGTVTLQGSGTDTNSGGSITGYAWTQSAGTTVTLSSASTANPTFTAPTVTSSTMLTFGLVVTDNLGLSSSPASVTVTVLPQGSQIPPTAMANANPTSQTSGGSVTLQGSGTDQNSGATITGYQWSQTAGTTVTLSSTTAQNPTFTAPTVTSNMTLTFSLVVTDSLSLTSSPATVNVTVTPQSSGNHIKYVFVIAEENTNANTIYNSPPPYIAQLMRDGGYALNYQDLLTSPDLPSEPHYIWMEAGTNDPGGTGGGYTFTTDSDPSSSNSTGSTEHLATQIKTSGGDSWMSYQENLPASCPVSSQTPFASKHDPFVFFQDVAGNPPSSSNSYCGSHHKDFTQLAGDLAAVPPRVAHYNFITPNLCDDMHGDPSCSGNGCTAAGAGCISAGDNWLSANLPAIIAFCQQNQGVIFIVWDEAGSVASSTVNPFIVVGPNVKPGYSNSTAYSHSSLVKSVEEIMSLPQLSTVSSANDFSEFFTAGTFP